MERVDVFSVSCEQAFKIYIGEHAIVAPPAVGVVILLGFQLTMVSALNLIDCKQMEGLQISKPETWSLNQQPSLLDFRSLLFPSFPGILLTLILCLLTYSIYNRTCETG